VAIGVLLSRPEKVTALLPKKNQAPRPCAVVVGLPAQDPRFESEIPGSSGLSAEKIKKSLPRFHSSAKPGRINPRKKSVDAFLLF
jgi:hypothetical protein